MLYLFYNFYFQTFTLERLLDEENNHRYRFQERPGLSCSTLGLLYLCQKESWHNFDCKNRSQSHLNTHAKRLQTYKYGALLWPGFLHLGRPCPGLPITNKLRGLYNDPVPFKRAPFHGFGAQPRSRSERGTRSYYSLYLQIVQSVLIYI